MRFVTKEPGKAYIADRLWLPKMMLRSEPIKRALEFTIQSQTGVTVMKMWEESTNHIICPREFLQAHQYPKFNFPFVDLRPNFKRVRFVDKVTPRDEEQQRAWDAFSINDNGILNLGCGKGKTVLALKKIAQRGVPTLIIVPDGGIMEQWKESIASCLEFKGKVGYIQGSRFEWKHPIVLALVTTLWLRIDGGDIPEDLFRYYGMVIYDEVHRIGAPKFSLTASPFYGDRIGLTATVQREDGLDPIYRYHLGEPFYKDLVQDLKPRIYFQQTPAAIDYDAAKNDDGVTNISLLRTTLGKSLEANTFRYWSIKQALDSGRKVLCLSHSKAQLKLFHTMFPDSGLIIGDTEQSERMNILRGSQICFAIAKLGSEGVDDDQLDTLFWLTPFRSKISLQQSMGRIQRRRENKKTPVMIVFEDWLAPPLRKLCQRVKGSLREWGFPFDTLRPEPTEPLPSKQQRLYDAKFAELFDRSNSREED